MSEEDKLQNDILLYYCENIRPLLLELKLRRGDDHLLGINNEIRALNDHIARCYSESLKISLLNSEWNNCPKQKDIYVVLFWIALSNSIWICLAK